MHVWKAPECCLHQSQCTAYQSKDSIKCLVFLTLLEKVVDEMLFILTTPMCGFSSVQ